MNSKSCHQARSKLHGEDLASAMEEDVVLVRDFMNDKQKINA